MNNEHQSTALQAAFTTLHGETITQHTKTRPRAIRDALTTNENMTTKQDMNITPLTARRYAQYLDQNGDPQIILVSSTETEETLQRHFESTVGKRLEIVGFYWDTSTHQ